LTAGDFAAARALTDPGQLSDEKLAALFIVTEDGNFAPRTHRPVITITHDGESALLVVRLGSPGSPEAPTLASIQNTEFGLELAKNPEGKWRVASVNFSQLIADTATALGAGDVAYSPIVPDPDGGDSLALYFPFDQAGIHSRASRQLRIISSVLNADPNKRIKIDGHTDAHGSDLYNDKLSRERAINVRATLLSLGVPNDQIVMRVYGEAKPAAPNTLPDGTDNPPGRARNRRTEIYLDF
ncbi:MAG: OmpA family protein, partial [Verrucomicrobiales bacterium]|nr:OmpA family protein [Verrucomicrobiales bacterium]